MWKQPETAWERAPETTPRDSPTSPPRPPPPQTHQTPLHPPHQPPTPTPPITQLHQPNPATQPPLQPHQPHHPPAAETQKGNTPNNTKNAVLGYPKLQKCGWSPRCKTAQNALQKGPTALNTTSQHTHATQKNQHQKPQNTQLDTHRQNHTNPLTAKHRAKYSKFGNGARTGPRGFLYLVVFT